MNFRKFSKTIGALGLAALYTISTYGATVTDVTSAHWAYAAVVNLESRGIMALNSNGQFFPNQLMDYFEVADVLAKATGYVDATTNKNADPTLVAQIAANYEKQKPVLKTYSSKYTSWNSAYDRQIAYLLGRGYLNKSDLDKFITKTGNKETKNVVTKEQLSIFVVRMLGKAVTATQSYKTTGFKDEKAISQEARPYMAYLKNIGVINADSQGNGGGKVKVSKALCAKMIYSALQIKDTSSTTSQTTTTGNQNNTANTNTNNTSSAKKIAVVKKVLTKNTAEYYMLLEVNGVTSYYSIKNTTKIYDTANTEVPITKITGQTLEIETAVQNNTEYVTSAKLATAQTGSTSDTNGTGGSTGTNNTAGTDTTNGSTTTVTDKTQVTGVLQQEIRSGICRLTVNGDTTQTYLTDSSCKVTLDGEKAEVSDLQEGDTITAEIEKTIITQITATSGSTSQISKGELTQKKLSGGSYVLTVKKGSRTSAVKVPDSANIIRNGKSVEMDDIRIGDTIEFTKKNGTVTEVQATSTKTKAEGTISQIIIGTTPQIVLDEKNQKTTYNIASDAEVYDTTENKVISVRDLHIGQKASLLLDSKEVISMDVTSDSEGVSLTGRISKVGKRAAYIEMLVDYDYATGQKKVYKRIELTDKVKVISGGRSKDIYDLERDMDVVVVYKYLDDTMPQKILIVS